MTTETKISTLVIVADSAEARFLHFLKDENRLVEQPTLVNRSAHQRQQDLTTDAPGTGFDHVGRARHGISRAHTKEHDAEKLAREVAAKINEASREDSVRRIVLVAAPQFLGQLRPFLSAASQALITAEVNKNLTHRSEDDILVDIADHLTGRWLS